MSDSTHSTGKARSADPAKQSPPSTSRLPDVVLPESSDPTTTPKSTQPAETLTPQTHGDSTPSAAVSSGAVGGNGDLQISPGALAGVIVGPAVATALLTLGIILLLFRYKHTKAEKRRVKTIISLGEAKYSNSPSQSTEVHKWQKHLPQPVDDRTLRDKVRALRDQVDAHVANFYGNKRRSTKVNQDALQKLEKTVPRLDLPSHILLTQGPCPTDLIRRHLAGVLIHSDFLPPAVSAIQRSFLASSGNERSSDVAPQARGMWRVLTTYLQPSLAEDQALWAQHQAVIDAAAVRFSQAFQPWCVRDTEHNAHLVAVLERAAELAMLLFSQPYTYSWQWKDGAEEYVVFPSLLRISDEEGLLPVPATLVEGTVALRFWSDAL